VSGSNPGTEPPGGDFISECAMAIPAPGPFKVVSHQVLHESLIGQTITGHILIMQGAAQSFHVYTPHDKCPGVAATSETSKEHSCVIATNAGFFDMKKHSCIGDIISDGRVIHSDSSQRAMFGITNDGKVVAGYGNETFIHQTGFKQLVHGRGWLVHNGQNHVNQAAVKEGISKSFINLHAPRLAIGWNNEGQIILAVADGQESKRKGLDLNTFATLLMKLGAIEAVNLDGGGSVTLVWDGHICEANGLPNEPCKGNPTEFVKAPIDYNQRAVTSITCFK